MSMLTSFSLPDKETLTRDVQILTHPKDRDSMDSGAFPLSPAHEPVTKEILLENGVWGGRGFHDTYLP